jgi:hypothetical protein
MMRVSWALAGAMLLLSYRSTYCKVTGVSIGAPLFGRSASVPAVLISKLETLYSSRRQLIGVPGPSDSEEPCISSYWSCGNGLRVSTGAYTSVAGGPCTPLAGLELSRCGNTLVSTATVTAVRSGDCVLTCEKGGLAIPCISAAPGVAPASDASQGKPTTWHLAEDRGLQMLGYGAVIYASLLTVNIV